LRQAGKLGVTRGEVMLLSEHKEINSPHTEDVTLMLTKEAEKPVIDSESRGPWFITASFRTVRKDIKMNVVQCNTPTVGKSDEVKDQFYNQLQDTLNKVRDQDINILMTINYACEQVVG